MSFNGSRLRIARLFKDLSQRELAERIAVSHPQIVDFEKGKRDPKGDVLEALAVVLDVRTDFFAQHGDDEFREEETNFRKRIAATDRLKKQVLARATLFGMVVRHLSDFVQFPKYNLPRHTAESLDDVERIAEACREHWRLGLDTPIGSMSRVLENAGVVLMQVDLDTATRVDAFSRFGNVSIVVLNTEKGSASRTRFDTAHEAGHGVLHGIAGLPLDQREMEADRFASSFLLPRDAFSRDFRGVGRTDWAYMLELKNHWQVSLAAMVYRAYQLGLIDAAEYRLRFQYISKSGWRVGEPDEPEPEEPELFRIALVEYQKQSGKSTVQLASDLGWTPELFERVTGIVPQATPLPDANVLSLSDYKERQKGPSRVMEAEQLLLGQQPKIV